MLGLFMRRERRLHRIVRNLIVCKVLEVYHSSGKGAGDKLA